ANYRLCPISERLRHTFCCVGSKEAFSMIRTATGPEAAIATNNRVLVVLEVIVFLVAALMHAGVALPVGFVEPVIVPAAIVEGLIALFMAVSAYTLLARKTWAWWAT